MKEKYRGNQKAAKKTTESGKRVYISQADIPKFALVEVIRLAQSLYDDFGGKPTAPYQIAGALDISPTSSNWQNLCWASIAYGLTEGTHKSREISLADLGTRIVATTVEGDDAIAKVEAALRPKIARQFFERYNRAKFPQDKIALNILFEMGVPHDRKDSTLEILKRNGEFVGIIHQTKTGPFVDINTRLLQNESNGSNESDDFHEAEQVKEESVNKSRGLPGALATDQRVFITHGKNKEIVSQLKDLLVYGKLLPVVAEEHETTSRPVPEKVLEDMRSCFAGIIHVESEDELTDKAGKTHHKINENVLIEIGAAMALYGSNVILLVQKGIHLPSNLQGLYLSNYEGNKLDYDATMKLLKAFNEFK